MMDAALSRSPVFLGYSQAELDRAYDQRAWAPDAEAALARCRAAGRRVRASVRMLADIRYGDHADERLDVFPAAVAGAPIHVHIHGGGWRIQSKHDASFIAPAMTSAGMHFVTPEFTNLPACRMPDMIDQLARALGWVYRNAHEFGGDPDRILVSGHSSGAHLCAVLLTLDWAARGLPPDLVKAALCVSGPYDLAPVLLSARRDYIDLAPEEVGRLSPLRHVEAVRCPVIVVTGERESPEFIRQGMAFAGALRDAGCDVALIHVPRLDHFEINEAIGAAGAAPHAAAVRLMRRITPPAEAAEGGGKTA
jgi:arylformamidase